MKFLLGNRLNIANEQIQLIPFFPDCKVSEQSIRNDIQFIYVADGVPQKNHLTLLKAWEYLYEHHGLSPLLHLTLDQRYDTLIQQITSLQKKGIAIVNHGVISKDELNQLYSKCSYLVFPSLAESFGLPLIEAVQHGCGVLASDLPFVTDVIEPSDQFNPLLFNDIANRVAEFMQHSQFVPASLKVTNQVELLIRSIYS
ncbi:MAG: glycosyltransferase [Chitinophagaceae bacterium]|nr:glycosyltransferase [Chitinophagaceae bacterium]